MELIVVDNNSSDRTAQVVESYRPVCPGRLRYVCEAKIGLSHARNRAIHEASGDIIAFVDDDVYFGKNWLKEIRKAFDENSDISCVGGKSVPTFETPAPEWITEEMYKFYGTTRSGEHDRLMVFPEHPYGLNMAFRKSVFSQVGIFNPNLGRAKGCLLSNEELDLFHRIDKAGMKVYYASRALLYHRIPAERTDKRWIAERTYWQGISDVMYWQIVNPRRKMYLALKGLWISRKILRYFGKSCLRKLLPKIKAHSFKETLVVYRLMGIARQSIAEALSFRKC